MADATPPDPSATDEPADKQNHQAAQEPQGDLGDSGKKALDAERKARRDAEKNLKTLETRLREFEDRDKTEAQKIAERAEAAERELQATTGRLLRFEVAAAKGVPSDWASRLQGGTREELEADADELLTRLAPSTPSRGSFDGGPRTSAPAGADMNALLRGGRS